MLRTKLWYLSFSSDFHLYSSLLLLVVFLSLLICPKDTAPFDDVSSPNDVSEFVIVMENKNPRQRVYEHLSGPGLGVGCHLEQIELLGPADSSSPVIHPQLAENILGVRAKGIGRDNQFIGNFGAA